jgi:hypothetical protein
MMKNLVLACCLGTALICAEEVATDHTGNILAKPIPDFPSNFHAVVTIIAHLVDKVRIICVLRAQILNCGECACLQKEDYPPWKRVVELWFDGQGQRARSYVHAGYDANKTFLRRWDTRDEYCFRNDQHSECKRGFLSALPILTCLSWEAILLSRYAGEPMSSITFPDADFQPAVVRAHPEVFPGADATEAGKHAASEVGWLDVTEWHAVQQAASTPSRHRIYFESDSNSMSSGQSVLLHFSYG